MQKQRNKMNKAIKKKKEQHSGMFDYDVETSNRINYEENNPKKVEKNEENDAHKINIQRVNEYKIKEIKRKKQKERQKLQKELLKQEKQNTNSKIIKTRKKYTDEQIQKSKMRMKKFQYFSIIVLIIFAIILLLFSPIFYIKEIEIIGNERISKASILSLLDIGDNTNIFKETNKTINNKIKQNAYIDSVSIKKILHSSS